MLADPDLAGPPFSLAIVLVYHDALSDNLRLEANDWLRDLSKAVKASVSQFIATMVELQPTSLIFLSKLFAASNTVINTLRDIMIRSKGQVPAKYITGDFLTWLNGKEGINVANLPSDRPGKEQTATSVVTTPSSSAPLTTSTMLASAPGAATHSQLSEEPVNGDLTADQSLTDDPQFAGPAEDMSEIVVSTVEQDQNQEKTDLPQASATDSASRQPTLQPAEVAATQIPSNSVKKSIQHEIAKQKVTTTPQASPGPTLIVRSFTESKAPSETKLGSTSRSSSRLTPAPLKGASPARASNSPDPDRAASAPPKTTDEQTSSRSLRRKMADYGSE